MQASGSVDGATVGIPVSAPVAGADAGRSASRTPNPPLRRRAVSTTRAPVSRRESSCGTGRTRRAAGTVGGGVRVHGRTTPVDGRVLERRTGGTDLGGIYPCSRPNQV